MVDLYGISESGINQLETSLRDRINYRMAQMAFVHSDHDQTITCCTSITPNADIRIPADILLASTKALNGDQETAIRILQETISKENINKHIIDDAKVRLANIYSDLGEHRKTVELLSDMDNNSPSYPMSLLEKAWAYFLLKDYHKTVATTQELLTYFPSDKVVYEAACLDAYSQQTPTTPDKGTDVFQSVMDDAVLSWELENTLQERKQILMAFLAIKDIEDAVFMSGRSDLFERYLDTRSKMTILMQRLSVAEMWEANQYLKPVVVEQSAIAHLVKGLGDLSEPVERSSTSSTLHNFLNIQNDVTGLHSKLSELRQMIALRNPPFLQEHDAQFAKNFSAWVIRNTDEEMEKLEAYLASSEEMEKQSPSMKNYHTRFQLEQDRIKLAQAFKEMDIQRSKLNKVNPEIPETNLSQWAEFSFRRSYMSGGLFARYGQRQSRLEDVNSYLNSINQLLIDLESGTSEPQPVDAGLDNPDE
jgi:tetratricopeptide (TPR) repeat protein